MDAAARDPWLISQTLMQILYLLPPALLLWITFRSGAGSYVVLIPVVVMAAGQLAGGLAWLSISGEDAPDLVASAPIAAGRVLRAKIEAVIGMIALVFAPIVAALAFDSLFAAVVAGAGHLDGGGRRHAHSDLLPHAGQAQPVPPPADLLAHRDLRGSVFLHRLGRDLGAGGGGTWIALVPALIAIGILAGVRMISPSMIAQAIDIARAIALPRAPAGRPPAD